METTSTDDHIDEKPTLTKQRWPCDYGIVTLLFIS